MLKKVTIALVALVAMASVATAATLTADGLVIPGTPEVTNMGERELVNDGSFEAGPDVYWMTFSDSQCTGDVILDPTGVWGVPAYDGVYAMWCGGFCSGTPINSGACQELLINGATLTWWWMGYIEDGHVGNTVVLSFDGTQVWSYELVYPDDHTYGSWNQHVVDVSAYTGDTVDVCIELVATDGANMLNDYVELIGGTPTEDTSFSAVKSMY